MSDRPVAPTHDRHALHCFTPAPLTRSTPTPPSLPTPTQPTRSTPCRLRRPRSRRHRPPYPTAPPPRSIHHRRRPCRRRLCCRRSCCRLPRRRRRPRRRRSRRSPPPSSATVAAFARSALTNAGGALLVTVLLQVQLRGYAAGLSCRAVASSRGRATCVGGGASKAAGRRKLVGEEWTAGLARAWCFLRFIFWVFAGVLYFKEKGEEEGGGGDGKEVAVTGKEEDLRMGAGGGCAGYDSGRGCGRCHATAGLSSRLSTCSTRDPIVLGR